MAPEESTDGKKVSKEDFDITFNRIAVALAKREAIVKSWTASSSKTQQPTKTEEELDAEDAILFRNQPAHLGVGAPIPAHFLENDGERANKSLRAKLFPSKNLKESKARDVEEKAASAKRGLMKESSDEEEGRSALGKSKKHKKQSRSAHTEFTEDTEEGSVHESRSEMVSSKKPKPNSMHMSKASRKEQSEDEEQDIHAPKSKKQRISKQTKSDPEKEAKIQARLEALLQQNLESSEGKVDVDAISSKSIHQGRAHSTEKGETMSASQPDMETSKNVAIDSTERKKLKKREQKKRAKLRAAALAVEK